MSRTPLSRDTAPDIEDRLIAAWRAMSPAQKAGTISGLTQAAYAMTCAGVRRRHPASTEREHFLRVAIIVLGEELAAAAYPDAAPLIAANAALRSD